MSRETTFAAGVSRASLVAGPVFIATVALFTSLAATPRAVPVDSSVWMLAFLIVPALPIGALLALLPNLLGAALLAHLARDNAGLRLPAAWAVIGGVAAGGVAAGLSGGDTIATASFAATGAICALICRWDTHWSD